MNKISSTSSWCPRRGGRPKFRGQLSLRISRRALSRYLIPVVAGAFQVSSIRWRKLLPAIASIFGPSSSSAAPFPIHRSPGSAEELAAACSTLPKERLSLSLSLRLRFSGPLISTGARGAEEPRGGRQGSEDRGSTIESVSTPSSCSYLNFCTETKIYEMPVILSAVETSRFLSPSRRPRSPHH